MFNTDELYNMIESLRVTRTPGISRRQLLSDCGLAQSTLSNIASGSMPSVDKAAAIAEYFGISLDELVGREKINAPAEASRSELGAILMQMNRDEIERLVTFARFLLSERQAQEPPTTK